MKSKHLKIRPQYKFLGCVAVILALRWLGGAYVNAQKEAIAAAIMPDAIQELRAPGVIFVTINGKDPTNNFTQRFNQNTTIIRNRSDGARNVTRDAWRVRYVDKSTGKTGALIGIGVNQYGWLVPFSVEASVNYPGRGKTYTLRKSFQGWKVVHKEDGWIA